MGFFVIPQAWITPAILAAALHFGSTGQSTRILYHAFPPGVQAATDPETSTIWIDKRRHWDKRQVQCLLVHEYGHMRRGPGHSRRPDRIMSQRVRYDVCVRWLRRHDVPR